MGRPACKAERASASQSRRSGFVLPAVPVGEGQRRIVAHELRPRVTGSGELEDALHSIAEEPHAHRTGRTDALHELMLVVGAVLMLVGDDDGVAPRETLGDGGRVAQQFAGVALNLRKAWMALVDCPRPQRLRKSEVADVALDQLERERVQRLHPSAGARCFQPGGVDVTGRVGVRE